MIDFNLKECPYCCGKNLDCEWCNGLGRLIQNPEKGSCRIRRTPRAIPIPAVIVGWASVNRPTVRIGAMENMDLPVSQVEVPSNA